MLAANWRKEQRTRKGLAAALLAAIAGFLLASYAITQKRNADAAALQLDAKSVMLALRSALQGLLGEANALTVSSNT